MSKKFHSLHFALFFAVLTILISAALFYQLEVSADKYSQLETQLSACQQNQSGQNEELNSCEASKQRLFQPYSQCNSDQCLFVNEKEVQGFFTFTGRVEVEQGDFMGTPVTCTYFTVIDAPATTKFLLEERFGDDLRFAIGENTTLSQKKGQLVTVTSTFPYTPDFGPLPCPEPSISILSHQ